MKRKRFLLGLFAIVSFALCGSCENDRLEKDERPATPQLIYLGLKDKTDVRAAQELVWNEYERRYSPKIKIIDDYLYVLTTTGVYRKSITSLNGAVWELYAFKDIPIVEFVKNGNSVLAATTFRDLKAILLSSDNGLTYQPGLPESFIGDPSIGNGGPCIYSMAQNPRNPESLLIIARTDNVNMFGVLKSTNFGKSWTPLHPWQNGYQEWYVGFNPHDTTSMYRTGESMIFNASIYRSVNDGRDWECVESMDNNCIHSLAFHPSDTRKMVYSGEYLTGKSNDGGKTWRSILLGEIYAYKILYDKNNPEIVYTSGITRDPNLFHQFTMYRSKNGGNDWDIFFQTNLPGEGGVIDFELSGNKLFLYTYSDGIYLLTIPD